MNVGWHGQAERRHAEGRHAGARLGRAWACHPTRRIKCVAPLEQWHKARKLDHDERRLDHDERDDKRGQSQG